MGFKNKNAATKFVTLLSFFVLMIFVAFAQEQYDIVNFKSPQGWTKDTTNDMFSFAKVDGGSWGQLAIYKSTASKGSIEADMKSEWEKIVLLQHSVTKEEEKKSQKAGGWFVMSRSGIWQYNGANVAVILTTYSNKNICISILCNATAQPYLKDYQTLIKTVQLNAAKHPLQSNSGDVAMSAPTTHAGASTGIAGTWSSYINETSGYINGMPQTTGGYYRKEYKFNADGTYTFLEKGFPAYSNNIFFRYESGSWLVSGNKLIITPAKGNNESWSKNASGKTDEWGKLLKTGKGKLEKVNYCFEIKYLSGMGKNYLVLTHNVPTERDGTQNNNSGMQTWQYSSEPVGKSMIAMPPR